MSAIPAFAFRTRSGTSSSRSPSVSLGGRCELCRARWTYPRALQSSSSSSRTASPRARTATPTAPARRWTMSDEGQTLDDVREEIVREISRVHEEAYGAGISNVEITMGDDLVAIAMDVELSQI